MNRETALCLLDVEKDVAVLQRLMISDHEMSYDDYKDIYLQCNNLIKMIDDKVLKLNRELQQSASD